MFRTLTRTPKHRASQWLMIAIFSTISGLLIFVPLVWLFHKMSTSWGEDAAQIILAFTSIGLLVVVLMGAGIGLSIDYAIHHRKFIFHDPQPGSWVYSMIGMWGYEIRDAKVSELEPVPREAVSLSNLSDEPYKLPEKAKRQGRKPQFTVKDWARVALKWEQRDPTFDIFTLEQVICQELGTNPDGSPIISEKAYRGTWRIRAIRYINEHGLAKRPIPED